jgi:hypothetical protein
MSARGRDGGGEAPEPMAAEDLVSLLYGELEPDEAARTGARVEADPVLSARLGEMRRVRELFASLEEQEPPGRLTAQLMAEAARAAPQARRAAAPAEAGLWSRFVSWLQPVLQRPALAAAASLVLVAGVASVLYMRKGEELTSTAPPPGAATETVADGNAAAQPVQPAATPPVTAATEGGEDRSGMADGDEAAPPAEEAAKSDPAATRDEKPTAKRRKSVSTAGDKNAYEKSPPKPSLKSGTVYGLSEQEMVPRDQAQGESAPGGGGAVGGAQQKADDAPAAPAPPPEPAPSTTTPSADSKAPAPSKPNVRDLHKRAIDAALDNRCAEVKMLAGQVRATDSAYYAKSFAGDQRLQKCLASPSRAPSKK